MTSNLNAVDIPTPAAVTALPGEIYRAPCSGVGRSDHKLVFFNEPGQAQAVDQKLAMLASSRDRYKAAERISPAAARYLCGPLLFFQVVFGGGLSVPVAQAVVHGLMAGVASDIAAANGPCGHDRPMWLSIRKRSGITMALRPASS